MDTISDWIDPDKLVESYVQRCPARESLAVLADKWVLLVLAVLGSGETPIRFNELRRRLDGITQKMLTRTLRTLEREGLVRRAVYPTVPPRVEYSLTDLGFELRRRTHVLGLWIADHHAEMLSARKVFDEREATTVRPL